jgi:hypothetical protein
MAESIIVDSFNEADFNNDHDKEPKIKEVASKGKKRENPNFTSEYFERIVD